VLAVAGLSLTVVGCSSSAGGTGSNASAPGITPLPPPRSSATSAPVPATGNLADSLELGSITLQPTDLPSGWQATKPDTDTGDAVEQAQLVACTGGRNTGHDAVRHSDTTYDRGANEISSHAERIRTQADVVADVAILRSPKISSCYQEQGRRELGTSLSHGEKLTSFTFRFSPGTSDTARNVTAVGDGKAVFTVEGRAVVEYMDVAFITGPRLEAEVDFFGVGTPIDAALQHQLIATVAERAATL
jgi:hypothetical protein